MNNKPFYLKMISNIYKKNDIIKDGQGFTFIIINPCCKDQWWKKILRFFFIPIHNRTGCIKIKLHNLFK